MSFFIPIFASQYFAALSQGEESASEVLTGRYGQLPGFGKRPRDCLLVASDRYPPFGNEQAFQVRQGPPRFTN
jgi:hypothetical protein